MEAEKMLNVARTALDMLQCVEKQEQVEVLWVSAITCLRGVGHVLKKIDRNAATPLARRIDEWWECLNENKTAEKNRIFFDFIEKERNNTIKEFSISYDKSVQGSMIIENIETKETYFVGDMLPSLLYIPMTDGYFEGEDIRDLISQAIDWWEDQLDSIKG